METTVEMGEVAAHVQISRRQLERLFRKYVSVTPAQFYIELRISRAHALLSETPMSVAEIAVATGFGTSSQLSSRFKKRYGKSPSAYRKRRAEPVE